jgi:hypothetical protein
MPLDRIDADEIEGRCDVLARYSVLSHTYLRWDLEDHGCSGGNGLNTLLDDFA